jgi:hypothetical protein
MTIGKFKGPAKKTPAPAKGKPPAPKGRRAVDDEDEDDEDEDEDDEDEDEDEAPPPRRGKAPPAKGKPAKGKPAPGRKPAKRSASRFANAEESEGDNTPVLGEGTYRLRYKRVVNEPPPSGKLEYVKTYYEVVEAAGKKAVHEVGDEVVVLCCIGGTGAAKGMGRVVAQARAIAGYDDPEAWREYDPNAYFIDTWLGTDNPEFATYEDDAAQLPDRLVDVRGTRGNALADGSGFYTNYAWLPVPEDEQE